MLKQLAIGALSFAGVAVASAAAGGLRLDCMTHELKAWLDASRLLVNSKFVSFAELEGLWSGPHFNRTPCFS